MPPELLEMLAAGGQGNNAARDAGDPLGGMMGMMGNNIIPMLLMLAGMGLRETPRLIKTWMDYKAMQQQGPDQAGALPTPQDPAALLSALGGQGGQTGAPTGGMPGGGMPGGGMPGRGMPPQLAALLQLAQAGGSPV